MTQLLSEDRNSIWTNSGRTAVIYLTGSTDLEVNESERTHWRKDQMTQL